MQSELINEIVTHRQFIEDLDGLENLTLKHRDYDLEFRIYGPVTLGKLRVAFRFLKLAEDKKHDESK